MAKRNKWIVPQINIFWIASGLTSIFSLIVYLSIAPARLSLGNMGIDNGDFLAAILTKGIPHPTGYPTFTLLGIIFQFIPISTPVFRGVLASLIPASVAVGLLVLWVGYALGGHARSHLLAAIGAGLAWSVSPLLVSQAVIVDVHGLQSLITMIVLWWITLNLEGKSLVKRNLNLFLSFLIGVGCGNHVTILLLAPVCAASLFLLLKRGAAQRFVLAEILCILLGLSVYLYLPISARAYPAINWGNPQTLAGFLWDVTGNPYRGLLFSISTTVFWERASSMTRLFLDQFGALGVIVGVSGFVQTSFRDRWLRWLLIWIFVAYIIFTIGYNTGDSIAYLLPSILVFAIWIGIGIQKLWILNWKKIPMGIFLSLLILGSLLLRVPGTLAQADARSQDQPARYAEQFLNEAPKNAILFTSATEDTFPLWYYHFGLKYRPDVRIIALPLTQFVWYQEVMIHAYSDLSFPPINAQDVPNTEWGQEIKQRNAQRPVCYSSLSTKTELGVIFTCSHT